MGDNGIGNNVAIARTTTKYHLWLYPNPTFQHPKISANECQKIGEYEKMSATFSHVLPWTCFHRAWTFTTMAHSRQTLAQKRYKVTLDSENRLWQAAQAYCISPLVLPNSQRHSFWGIAQAYSINVITLSCRLRGGRSILFFNISKQLLIPTEKDVVVNLAQTLAFWHIPFTYWLLRNFASAIVSHWLGHYVDIGLNWPYYFLDRHCQQLKTYWSSGVNSQRTFALTAEGLNGYFNTLEYIQKTRQLKAKFKFAMNDICFWRWLPISDEVAAVGWSIVATCKSLISKRKFFRATYIVFSFLSHSFNVSSRQLYQWIDMFLLYVSADFQSHCRIPHIPDCHTLTFVPQNMLQTAERLNLPQSLRRRASLIASQGNKLESLTWRFPMCFSFILGHTHFIISSSPFLPASPALKNSFPLLRDILCICEEDFVWSGG